MCIDCIKSLAESNLDVHKLCHKLTRTQIIIHSLNVGFNEYFMPTVES